MTRAATGPTAAHWRFVRIGGPQVVCARDGHDTYRRWDDPFNGWRRELTGCRRCGVEVEEFRARREPVRA